MQGAAGEVIRGSVVAEMHGGVRKAVVLRLALQQLTARGFRVAMKVAEVASAWPTYPPQAICFLCTGAVIPTARELTDELSSDVVTKVAFGAHLAQALVLLGLLFQAAAGERVGAVRVAEV